MNAQQKFQQLAETVTNEIIEKLEQGVVIWQKPWGTAGFAGLPKNYKSGRCYEGFNAFYLNYVTIEKNYRTPNFITFNQAKELGGNVRKGEKGTQILFWKIYGNKVGEKTTSTGETKDVIQNKFVPFIWTVFNIDQIEGVEFKFPEVKERTENEIIEACQSIVDNYPVPAPRIQHGGSEAYYAPFNDKVQMPAIGHFVNPQSYHSVLFHELIHSTGHEVRLNRFTPEDKTSRFGDTNYSKEELVAEMGASFLNAHTGIKDAVIENSVAYLKGWASKLKDDKTMIIYASTKAFKAASFILNLKPEPQEQEQEAAQQEA
ncbi:ArdC family protein [Rufibacter sp. XAAS-G3-1]|uniref:ArdC family protein n=1 Tax=Rufibacter sp. XAAS-G3-1 TaxID=2729134 RepID=UPI0015E69ECB|nr:ArdC-like ssDNA-binding domain-containing protein [Rufibacter sp. XAAS-G3-1]